MPYFWENTKWETRLKQCGIEIPSRSGHAFSMNSNEEEMNETSLAFIAGECLNIPKYCLGNSQTGKDLSSLLAVFMAKNLAESGFDINKSLFIGPLFQMLNLHRGDSIVEKLLDTQGVGRVKMTKELEQIQLNIGYFLSRLSSCMEQHHPWYAFTPHLIGSMAEGTRVGYGDEYDFRLDLCAVEKDNIIPFIPDNYDLMTLQNEINTGTLSVLADFYPALQATLMSLGSHMDEEELHFLGHGFMEKRLIFLFFQWGKGMLVKVDCVPAIPMPGTWPSKQHIDPMGETIIPACHIILKYLDDDIVPTWSVCAAEQHFCQQLPQNVKDAVMLSKIICGPVILLGAHFLIHIFWCLRSPDSYHLKNSLFQCIASKSIDYNNKTIGIDAIIDMTSKIFEYFFSSQCVSYFFDRVLLTSDDILSCHFVLRRILGELKEQHNTRQVPAVQKVKAQIFFHPVLQVMQQFTSSIKDLSVVDHMDPRESERVNIRPQSYLFKGIIDLFRENLLSRTDCRIASTSAEPVTSKLFGNELGVSELQGVPSDDDSDISLD